MLRGAKVSLLYYDRVCFGSMPPFMYECVHGARIPRFPRFLQVGRAAQRPPDVLSSSVSRLRPTVSGGNECDVGAV